MEIYKFEYGVFTKSICALAAVGMICVALLVIKFLVRQIKSERKNASKLSLGQGVGFAIFTAVPVVLAVLFGSLFARYTAYDYNMSKGNASFMEGDVLLVSCEEEHYKGTFSGYKVVLESGGQIICPSNTFSAEVVGYFERLENLVVQYGIVGKDVCIWRISVAQ